MNSDVSDFNPEVFKLLPEVVKALEEPRKPRSVLNYMCGCDTADPVIRLSLDTEEKVRSCLLYTSPSPRDQSGSRMPSSA